MMLRADGSDFRWSLRTTAAGVVARPPGVRGPSAGPSGDACGSRAGKEGENLADGESPGTGLGQRQMGLDLVAVTAAALLPDHVAGAGEIADDSVGAALGDAHAGRDIAQPRARVAGDA